MSLAISGVYAIRNKMDGKVYVGSSVDIHHRWRDHKSALNNNRHHSPHLQNAWNKLGQESFEFLILVITLRIPRFSVLKMRATLLKRSLLLVQYTQYRVALIFTVTSVSQRRFK